MRKSPSILLMKSRLNNSSRGESKVAYTHLSRWLMGEEPLGYTLLAFFGL